MLLTVAWHLYICFHLLVHLGEGCIMMIQFFLCFEVASPHGGESLYRAFFEPSHALRDEASLVDFSMEVDDDPLVR